MSKYKKTWLPIAIVLVLAGLIIVLALIGSQFKDDTEEAAESPEPSAELVLPTAEPSTEPTPTPTPSAATTKKTTSSSSGSGSSANSKNEDDDKSEWEKFGEQVGSGMKDARETLEEGVQGIGEKIGEAVSGDIMSPQEFVNGVNDFFSGIAAAANQSDK